MPEIYRCPTCGAGPLSWMRLKSHFRISGHKREAQRKCKIEEKKQEVDASLRRILESHGGQLQVGTLATRAKWGQRESEGLGKLRKYLKSRPHIFTLQDQEREK
eukprot:TRINITY_DN50375_c0_g1_i1.p1 TRINITY_DN50375_c0_g1~~TRINITY_DN50375_c0_g1_i1.p1  ORF type:complete len:116 (-),score=8.34 TRINITY_DN50375_c0_g1_i1:144-455(-)